MSDFFASFDRFSLGGCRYECILCDYIVDSTGHFRAHVELYHDMKIERYHVSQC